MHVGDARADSGRFAKDHASVTQNSQANGGGHKQGNVYIPGPSFRGAKWIGKGRVPLSNPLGFYSHPLESPGIYIYICR